MKKGIENGSIRSSQIPLNFLKSKSHNDRSLFFQQYHIILVFTCTFIVATKPVPQIHYHILTPFLRFQPPNQSGQFTTKPSVWIYQRKNPLHQLLSPFSRPKIIVSHSNEQMGVKPRERERAWPRAARIIFGISLSWQGAKTWPEHNPAILGYQVLGHTGRRDPLSTSNSTQLHRRFRT